MKRNNQQLVKDLISGNKAALARAITVVEKALNCTAEAVDLLQHIPSNGFNAKRIGISGIPGVGKSTLIESFGMHLIDQGLKVAVLAIDPSSSIGKGSILGDKTRMHRLSTHPNAFVRPTPTTGIPGGIAPGTYEAVILCEAAGYDVVFVETVGVGQSEYLVESVTDLFLYLTLPNTGDELQGLKRGIMESIDICFVNKTDLSLPNLNTHLRELEHAFHGLQRNPMLPPVEVLSGSGLNGQGIPELWQSVQAFYTHLGDENLEKLRQEKNKRLYGFYLKELLYQQIKATGIATGTPLNAAWEKVKSVLPPS